MYIKKRPNTETIEGEKICRKCLISKIIKDFGSDIRNNDQKSIYCRICTNIRSKEQYQRKGKPVKQLRYSTLTKEYKKDKALKSKYNITLDDYNELFNNQNGSCYICNIHQRDLKKSLAVDHDHKTGKVRALLCNDCNRGLGEFKDSSLLLKKAINYLEQFNKKEILNSYSNN